MPSVGELIRSGRAFVAERWGFILVATVGVPVLISIVSEMLGKMLGDSFLLSQRISRFSHFLSS